MEGLEGQRRHRWLLHVEMPVQERQRYEYGRMSCCSRKNTGKEGTRRIGRLGDGGPEAHGYHGPAEHAPVQLTVALCTNDLPGDSLGGEGEPAADEGWIGTVDTRRTAEDAGADDCRKGGGVSGQRP